MRKVASKALSLTLADDELTLVCGGFDSFGASGLASDIATLGVFDDTAPVDAVSSEAWETVECAASTPTWDGDASGVVLGNEGYHLTENADGTFSAVGVYEPTATYDVSRWAETTCPSEAQPLDDDSALALALRHLVA